MAFQSIARGATYPYPLPENTREGAAAQLCRKGGSFIQIMLPEMTQSEQKLLRKGKMKIGMIVDQPVILLILQFGDMIMECPFDIRLLPKDEVAFDSIENNKQRWFIDIHIVDSKTNIVKGLRGITFPPRFTRKLFSAIQDQYVHQGDFQQVYKKYLTKNMNELKNMANMVICGQD